MRTAARALVPQEVIGRRIFLIRGQKVMLDSDLAWLYGVETKALNRAVRRNIERFPADFMFQLTLKEARFLRCQSGTLNDGSALRSQFVTLKRGENIKYLPCVFTEQGVAMLSGVLRSRRAVQVNIAIMRAFVKLRRMLSTHKALARKLQELETKTERHDTEIRAIFDAIRELMSFAAPEPARRIGFHKV